MKRVLAGGLWIVALWAVVIGTAFIYIFARDQAGTITQEQAEAIGEYAGKILVWASIVMLSLGIMGALPGTQKRDD